MATDPLPSSPQFVIGEQMARAREAERRRAGQGLQPPIDVPEGEYDEWRGETCLLRPAPTPLDAALATFCQRAATSDDAVRAKLRRALSMDELYTLLAFSRRMSVFGMRERSADRVRDGLRAIALDQRDRVDYRDVFIALGLLGHAAMGAECDGPALFREAAALAEPAVAELIAGCASQSARGMDVRSACGYAEIETEAGPGFVGWGLRKYRPTQDLQSVALDIAGLLERDRYAASVELAAALPRVWFGRDRARAVDDVLQVVRAGALVHGRLRPSAHPTHASQGLFAFLVELPGELQARVLLERSQQMRPTSFAHVGVMHGPLFCLVIARSVEADVRSYETAERLARFAPGIADVLVRRVRLT